MLICGSRSWRDGEAIRRALLTLPRGTTIIHGGARGADQLAGTIACAMGFQVREYPADWRTLGRRAGVLRNLQMLDQEPRLVLAFWDGRSLGTKHAIDAAQARGIEVRIYARR